MRVCVCCVCVCVRICVCVLRVLCVCVCVTINLGAKLRDADECDMRVMKSNIDEANEHLCVRI